MRLVKRVDFGNPVFVSSFKRLKIDIKKEARRIFGELILLDLDEAPAKLHFHNLQNKMAPSALDSKKKVHVYTIHITSSDSHKASFTYEQECVYLRYCGEHDEVDSSP